MSVLGIILLVVCALILVVFLFFLYLGGSKENYLIEVKKLSPAMGILMVLTIVVGVLLFFDTPSSGRTEKMSYLLSQRDSGKVEFYESYDPDLSGKIAYKFKFSDGENQMEAWADPEMSEIVYSDDSRPSVTCYETHLKTRVTGRESVSRHYIFYLPTSMEDSTMNEDNASNASVVE